ncbi:MAG: S-layer homology domain-containing protein, partial [Oscillospiraceae bacterium]|nr:S-layer homology domain-containing protein [Oscillospiraceae bacterium]
VTATGGSSGAGIGGGSGNNGGTVTISGGTVTAIGGVRGAGIGGGSGMDGGGNGGTVIIRGGSVTAVGDTTYVAENIGKGYYGASSGTLTDGTNPVYLYTLTIGNPPVANAPVTAVNIGGDTSYDVRDLFTDGDGKVYFYLPISGNGGTDAEIISLTAGGTVYSVVFSRSANPSEVTFLTPPILTAGDVSRTSDTEATVEFTSDAVGTYYYQLDGTAPTAAELVTAGTNATALTAAEHTISPTLTAGAHTIYIAAKDAAGNVSNLLTIDIPTFDAPSVSFDIYYNVTFNSNGGSAVAPKSVVDGGKVVKPADPTKADYTFGGWFTDAELTKEYDFSAKVTKKFTLYANWVEIQKETESEETPDAPDAPAFPFDDVNDGHWFYDDVVWAWENGLIKGTDERTFSPDLNTTRGQIVTILYRLSGEPAVSGSSPFADVDSGAYYAAAVAWASENGIANGYTADIFAPEDDLTREQIVTLLWRYAGSPAVNATLEAAPTFHDADEISGYAKAAFAWAISVGIVQGDDAGRLNPQTPATRAEVAALFHRYTEKVK